MTGAPDVPYADLRAMALGAARSGVIPRHEQHPAVFGVVVDVSAPGGHVTVVALGDNSTSLYTSAGSGTIGAGEHPEVAAATHRLLAVAEEHLDMFTEGDDESLPPAGQVSFHVLTAKGLRRADVREEAFWGEVADPLLPVIAATQDVITRVRELSP